MHIKEIRGALASRANAFLCRTIAYYEWDRYWDSTLQKLRTIPKKSVK